MRPAEEFLAVFALRLVLCGYLIGEVTRTVAPDTTTTIAVVLDGRPAPADRVVTAQLLVAPLGAYGDLADVSFTSKAADTGAIAVPVVIAGGVVAVSAVVAGAYLLTQVADKAADIVDRALKRNASSSEIQKADAQVLQLVSQHVQREQVAGQALPLDDATQHALSALKDRVNALVRFGYVEPSKPINFPSWALPAAGLAAAAAVTAVVVWKGKRK